MSDQPPSGQPPPSYQPPPPSNPNPLIPQGSQRPANIMSKITPRIWVGVGIVVVVIAALLFWSSQQRGADTTDRADRIALEQTSTQNAVIFITQTFSAITPTIDAQVAALQTQNALQAQALTDQAATNQAIALLPTQTPIIIIATPLPQPQQVFVVTATPQSSTTGSNASQGIQNCPKTPKEVAALIGGEERYWVVEPNSQHTGWKYAPGSPPVTMTAPNFGHVDTWNGQTGKIINGEKAQNVTEATFWCAA